MSSTAMTPNSREGITAQSTITNKIERLTSTSGALNVNASVSITGGATSANQTNGTQKTQIVDGSGNVIAATSNALNVAVISGGGGGTQYADGTARGTATGTLMMVDDGTNIQSAIGTTAGVLKVDLSATTANATAIKVDGSAVTQPVSGTVTANQGTAAAITAGWPILNSELADFTGTFTNATQTTSVTTTGSLDGYESATVSINGTYGTATAVFEGSDDSGTTWYTLQAARTSDGTIETGYTSLTNISRLWTLPITGLDQIRVRSTAVASGTANIRISVSSAANADAASVTIGTALPAGTALLGKVGIDQTTPGTTNLVALAANQSVNVAQINGITPLMGNGVTGTGSQRVTIASDNTAFAVNATLSAETTKVIGVVRTADGSGNLLTSTTNALDVNIKTSAATNISTNVAQLAGATTATGVGVSGTGTLRVVEANDLGRTLKSAGGSVASSGNNTLIAAGTNKLKVFAFSLTTTSTSSTTCIFQSGAGGTELWRVVLQAPTSVNVGANLAVAVPAYLFSTASATLLNLNLSGANTVHWSCGYFDEA